MKNVSSRWALALALLGVPTMAACAGARAPDRARADTVEAIGAARALGATGQPDASLHLALATEQLTVADRRIADGDMEEATRLLRQAEADAAVAVSLAREARTRAAAEATMMRIETMQTRTRQGESR